MIRYIYFIFVLLFCIEASADKVIRVLLDQTSGQVSVSFKSPLRLTTTEKEVTTEIAEGVARLQYANKKWMVDVESASQRLFYEIPGRDINLKSRKLFYKKTALHFPLRLRKKRRYLVVGSLGVEFYLTGVLPNEMPSSWPIEALKAQAVASRTYAFWQMRSRKKRFYDVKSSVLDQVFKFDHLQTADMKVKRALEETRGMVLVDNKKRPLKTYFHSDCGGQTGSARDIWGVRDLASVGVKDRFCRSRKIHRWSVSLNNKIIFKKLSRHLILPPKGKIVDVVVKKQASGFRVKWIDLIFETGYLKRLRAEDLRRILGYKQIKSTAFSIEKKQGGWLFLGQGSGHGVGLCQWGARSLAKKGTSFQDILRHYYQHKELIKVDSSESFLVSFLNQ